MTLQTLKLNGFGSKHSWPLDGSMLISRQSICSQLIRLFQFQVTITLVTYTPIFLFSINIFPPLCKSGFFHFFLISSPASTFVSPLLPLGFFFYIYIHICPSVFSKKEEHCWMIIQYRCIQISVLRRLNSLLAAYLASTSKLLSSARPWSLFTRS